LAAPAAFRRQLNQALFEQIEVFAEGPSLASQQAEPFRTLLDPMLVQPEADAGSDPAAGGTVAWAGGMRLRAFDPMAPALGSPGEAATSRGRIDGR